MNLKALPLAMMLSAFVVAGCGNNKAENTQAADKQDTTAQAPAIANTSAPKTGESVNVKITGAGASFPQPIYAKWSADFNAATQGQVNYQSIGSSGGIKQIIAKTVDFGATDAPLSIEELNKEGLIQFPTVIGGVVPVVNIDGVAAGQLKVWTVRHWQTSILAKSPNGTTLPSPP